MPQLQIVYHTMMDVWSIIKRDEEWIYNTSDFFSYLLHPLLWNMFRFHFRCCEMFVERGGLWYLGHFLLNSQLDFVSGLFCLEPVRFVSFLILYHDVFDSFCCVRLCADWNHSLSFCDLNTLYLSLSFSLCLCLFLSVPLLPLSASLCLFSAKAWWPCLFDDGFIVLFWEFLWCVSLQWCYINLQLPWPCPGHV